MKQFEADALAKVVRNLKVPLDVKRQISSDIVKTFLNLDQFFNAKRFKGMADLDLDDNYNNLTGYKYEEN